MPASTGDGSENRLAVYGSLAPGKKNHWVLAGIAGAWSKGTVRGHLHQEGWGATDGFPAMTYDDNGDLIEVQVFESEELPAHWARLDEFEGEEYQRVLVPVFMANRSSVLCNIYELNRKLKKDDVNT
jgi:gamma-glutamylcyclotransferase (GGCT)/AIG2-like uncharacterized protein YtfP